MFGKARAWNTGSLSRLRAKRGRCSNHIDTALQVIITRGLVGIFRSAERRFESAVIAQAKVNSQLWTCFPLVLEIKTHDAAPSQALDAVEVLCGVGNVEKE